MTQSIEEILEKLIEQVQQIAFDIPAPNDHTPVFVALATNARSDLNKFRAMEAARPTTDVSPEIDKALRMAHRKSTKLVEILPSSTDVSTDGLVALAIRGALGLKGQQITDLQLDGGIERAAQAALAVIQPTLEALQRSNAEKDERILALEAAVADAGYRLKALSAALREQALSHSSETSK
jgi:hypothetical protein